MSSTTVLRRMVSVAGLITVPWLLAGQSPPPPPPASEVEAIRREMQQLREDYERRLQLLDQRLRQLEQPTPAPAAAVWFHQCPLGFPRGIRPPAVRDPRD